MIRIAVVGCGRIARNHLKAVMESGNDCLLTALVDVERRRAEDYAREYGCDNVFDDISDAAGSSAFDAAIICLPHHLLSNTAQTMLAGGKHVLVEKPCGVNSLEYSNAMETADRYGLVMLPAYVARFNVDQSAFLEVVKSGELGEIYNINFVMFVTRRGIATPWWAKTELAGGFWLPIWGSHRLDEMLCLAAGPPETIYASCRSNRRDVEGETDGMLAMRFGGGVFGTLSFLSAETGGRPFGGKMVIGSKGTLLNNGNGNHLNGKKMGDSTASQNENDFVFHRQLLHFIRTIEGDRPRAVTAQDGFNVLRVINAAHESNRENRVVDFGGR